MDTLFLAIVNVVSLYVGFGFILVGSCRILFFQPLRWSSYNWYTMENTTIEVWMSGSILILEVSSLGSIFTTLLTSPVLPSEVDFVLPMLALLWMAMAGDLRV